MPEHQIVTMPFGRYRGYAVHEVDTGYLTWCIQTCTNLAAGLRAAIEAELLCRGVGRTGDCVDDPRPAADHRPAVTPDTIDRRAVSALLSALLAAGIRVVARGDGAVHLYADGRPLSDELRGELGRLHGDIDALARHAAWESPTQRRLTPASVLLAGLRQRGVQVTARPGCVVEMTPESAQAELDTLSPAGRKELWFRAAVSLPDPAGQAAPDAPLNAFAGLHSYCLRQASRPDAAKARQWQAMADAVAALRAGQAAPGGPLANLADWCRVQAARAEQRGQTKAASRWRGWVEALGQSCLGGR